MLTNDQRRRLLALRGQGYFLPEARQLAELMLRLDAMDHPQPTIPCDVCAAPTYMTGTRLCDRCWHANRSSTRALSIILWRRAKPSVEMVLTCVAIAAMLACYFFAPSV